MEVLLSIWKLCKAKQDLPGFCYLPNQHNCNADKGQTPWAWALVTPSVLGTVDIQQLSEASVKKTGTPRKGQKSCFHTGSYELLFAGERQKIISHSLEALY